jgi:ATP-dependent RNA helicase DeaD
MMQGAEEPAAPAAKPRKEFVPAIPVGTPPIKSKHLGVVHSETRPPFPVQTEKPRHEKPVEKPVREKSGYERKPRTGRDPGYTTISFNVGRANLVTPADLVGKIAGVTRLPAAIVGAIDIHEDHTHVDVISEHAEAVVSKLAGIRVKNQSLKVAVVAPDA